MLLSHFVPAPPQPHVLKSVLYVCVFVPVAGGFLTTVPPGKALYYSAKVFFTYKYYFKEKHLLIGKCFCNLITKQSAKLLCCWDFPGGAVVKNPPANSGDRGSNPGPGISHMPRSN